MLLSGFATPTGRLPRPGFMAGSPYIAESLAIHMYSTNFFKYTQLFLCGSNVCIMALRREQS